MFFATCLMFFRTYGMCVFMYAEFRAVSWFLIPEIKEKMCEVQIFIPQLLNSLIPEGSGFVKINCASALDGFKYMLYLCFYKGVPLTADRDAHQ